MRSLVCIGFAEALAAPEVTWSLRDAGHHVIAFGRRDRVAALRHSRAATVFDVTPPEISYARTIADVESLLAKHTTNGYTQRTFFPLDDASVFISSRMQFDGTWQVAGPVGAAVDLALNKTLQTNLAREAGFHVPTTTEAIRRDQVLARVHELPLILRPARSVLAVGERLQKGANWICANEFELNRALVQWDEAWPLLVQPFIPGVGEGVFGLATAQGVQKWSGHRRLRMMNPHGSGSSACTSQAVSDDTRGHVAEFVRLCQWRGLFMVEMLREDCGRTWFVEFNGRPWGSLALSRHQGFEYPAWTVQATSHKTLSEPGTACPSRNLVCQNLGRELVHLLFVLRGPRSKSITNWPSFWRALWSVLRPGGERRLYNWRRNDWRVFISDCWYTVWSNVRKSKG